MIGGHGHVVPRPDGQIARCGGPNICKECALELTQLMGQSKVSPAGQALAMDELQRLLTERGVTLTNIRTVADSRGRPVVRATVYTTTEFLTALLRPTPTPPAGTVESLPGKWRAYQVSAAEWAHRKCAAELRAALAQQGQTVSAQGEPQRIAIIRRRHAAVTPLMDGREVECNLDWQVYGVAVNTENLTAEQHRAIREFVAHAWGDVLYLLATPPPAQGDAISPAVPPGMVAVYAEAAQAADDAWDRAWAEHDAHQSQHTAMNAWRGLKAAFLEHFALALQGQALTPTVAVPAEAQAVGATVAASMLERAAKEADDKRMDWRGRRWWYTWLAGQIATALASGPQGQAAIAAARGEGEGDGG